MVAEDHQRFAVCFRDRDVRILADLAKFAELEKRVEVLSLFEREVAKVLEKAKSDFILFSAKSRRGRDGLWKAILSLVEIEDPKLSV